ncbi:MAG TPA: glycosyltransferase family 39 protein [Anaerolineae bacterium]|nr:glycosyltransferase family 39 protein [Anaerolineae bacterium]
MQPRPARLPLSRRERFAVTALLLLAFALRTVDLTRVPPGLHNDEVVAAKFAEAVMNGHYAIFYPEDTGSEPLHYFFSAPIMSLFGSTVFALRLPSVALSLIAMSVMWAFARRLLGPIVALTALAGFAITFWTVQFGRIVSPVVMMAPLGALSAYGFWRASEAGGRRAWMLWVLSGFALGMSILSYTAARITPAIYVAFGAYLAIAHRAEWRRVWRGLAVVLLVAALVSLPMFIYLAQNPAADQLDFFDIDRPLVELQQGNLAPVIESTLNTLGMFAFTGDSLPYYAIPGRPIFEPAGALLLAAGLVIALWRWRRPEYAFVVLWFFLSLVPGMLSQPAPNSTRTLAVQVVLFVFPGITIAAILNRWRNRAAPNSKVAASLNRWRNPIVYAGLALLFAVNLVWTARDYFVVWPSMDTVRFWHRSGLKAVADRLQADPDASPVAICLPDELLDERDPWWKPAWQHMRYLLHRPDLWLRYYNCVDAMVFIDRPARYAVPDAGDASALAAFPIFTQFLSTTKPDLDVLPDRLGTIVRADVSTVLKQRLAEVAADSPVSWAPEAGSGAARLPVNFGNRAELLGYTLHPSSLTRSVHPSSFDLTTYWRVTGRLPPQLSQFTHVLDAEGNIVAQQDRLALTSASLRPGDVFAQIHRVTLPDDLPPGEYALSIGLYSYLDGSRLPIIEGDQPRSDRLWLRPIRLSE